MKGPHGKKQGTERLKAEPASMQVSQNLPEIGLESERKTATVVNKF
jgi:hypothetical protein